jgi:hypothetical protein
MAIGAKIKRNMCDGKSTNNYPGSRSYPFNSLDKISTPFDGRG